VPSAGLDLDVRAELDDQLMRVGLEYWEGSVAIAGSHAGRGYLEMTGYAPAR
jgi:predicted secreted hydrolase